MRLEDITPEYLDALDRDAKSVRADVERLSASAVEIAARADDVGRRATAVGEAIAQFTLMAQQPATRPQ